MARNRFRRGARALLIRSDEVGSTSTEGFGNCISVCHQSVKSRRSRSGRSEAGDSSRIWHERAARMGWIFVFDGIASRDANLCRLFLSLFSARISLLSLYWAVLFRDTEPRECSRKKMVACLAAKTLSMNASCWFLFSVHGVCSRATVPPVMIVFLGQE
jgi:hypothetical protein